MGYGMKVKHSDGNATQESSAVIGRRLFVQRFVTRDIQLTMYMEMCEQTLCVWS